MEDKKILERKKFLTPPISNQTEDYATQLRKERRNQGFMEKRMKYMAFPDENSTLTESMPVLSNPSISLEEKIVVATKSLSLADKPLLVFLRKTLSNGKPEQIEAAVNAGLIPKLDELLDTEIEEILIEAAWILTNLAASSSKYVGIMRNLGTEYKLLRMFINGSEPVKEQSLWALGNIIGDNVKARDDFLTTEIVERLVDIIKSKTYSLSLIRLACWTISNLCKGKPEPLLERIQIFIPPLGNLLTLSDLDTISETLWAISYITDGEDPAVKLVLKLIGVPPITNFALADNPHIKAPALRSLGNFCSGDSEDVDTVLSNNGLSILLNIMNTAKDPAFLKESCWILSNIAAGPEKHVGQIIDSGCFKALLLLISKTSDKHIRNEAAYAISNACINGTNVQICKMVEEGVIEALSDVLETSDPDTLLVALNALEDVLQEGENESKEGDLNMFAEKFEAVGGKKKLEQLQLHPNLNIYQKVIRILNNFYEDDEEDDTGIKQEQMVDT